MSDFALQFIPEGDAPAQPSVASNFAMQYIPEAAPVQMGPDGVPEGWFLNPHTGQMTSRELLANHHRQNNANGWRAAALGASQGMSLGFADEGAGEIARLKAYLNGEDPSAAANFAREDARAMQEADRKETPLASLGGEVLGSMALPGGAMKSGASMASNAARGAVAGGLMGMGYGAGTGEGMQDRLEGAANQGVLGAAVGGAAGAVLPKVLERATSSAQSRAAREVAENAPSQDELASAGSALYQSLDARGIKVRPDRAMSFADDLAARLDEEGMDRVVHPTAARAVARLRERAEAPVSLKHLDAVREIARSLPNTASSAERRFSQRVVDEVDNFVYQLVDGDVMSNQANVTKGLAEDLKEARGLWARMKQSETIREAIEAANNQASGVENGLRVQFRRLAKDKALMAAMPEEAQRAVNEVVRGSTVGNILKKVSRIGFGLGNQSSVLSGTAAMGVGAALGSAGGPVGAAAGAALPGIIGHLAAKGAERTTKRSANTAAGLAAAGRGAVPQAMADPNSGLAGLLQMLPQIQAPMLEGREPLNALGLLGRP